jgi:hypothetical protein
VRQLRLGTIVALAAALVALAVGAAPAAATQAIETFDVVPSTTEAGGHPDIDVSFTLASPGVPESAQSVAVNTPQGIFGNPNATPRCTSSDFALQQCQSGSQAGLITVRANYQGDPNKLLGTAPIFGLNPPGDQPALFAFIVPIINVPVSIPVAVRTGSDYGLRFTVAGLTQLAPLAAADLTFWGFPALGAHDPERFPKGAPGEPAGCPALADASCIPSPGVPAAIGVRPLIDNPSLCTGEPLSVSLEVRTYQDSDATTSRQAPYPSSTSCQAMSFKPVLQATPTTGAADSPAGLDMVLSAPQPLGFATTPSSIRRSVLTLPPDLTINPDAADGQGACAEAEARFGTEEPAACPDRSKIGTFEVISSALDGPLKGSLYIGEPRPGDQYRLFLVADGFGIHVKLAGSLRPDPATGQVTAVLDDLPQAPFEEFRLHLFASDRGLMATPIRCGIYPVVARFYPWNAVLPDVTSQQNFSIETGPAGAACPGVVRAFEPRLLAGTSNPTAGAFSDFTLKLDRDDGDQFLGDLNFRMPPGFTGDLHGIPYCPEGAIAAAAGNSGRTEQAVPSCPPASQIGTTNVAAGPGSHPFHAVGRMYLAGPLKGAPLSLAAVTPALAGPYDYGTQVVRVALHVDPQTAQVFAASDTVPSIIGGIPIRLRSIQVNIDRPRFTINPTNCASLSVDSQGIGDQGTIVDFSSYFHAVNCRSLGFKPSMRVRQLGGRSRARRARNPELQFDLTTRPGDANIKSLSVTLPSAFAIDQRHLGNICSEKELTEKQCAGRTPIGKASTTTPLLDQPLLGPVYAVSGSGGLPKLAFILNGQVNLMPRAETKTISKGGAGRLRTTVPVVPDAPIGHFRLNVFGGKTGYLVNTRDLCARAAAVEVEYTAQSGKRRTEKVRLAPSCGKRSK